MTPLELHDSASGEELQLLVGAGDGKPEMLLLLERPTANGTVRIRSWTSEDWSAPPTTDERPTLDLLREIEAWVRQRRGLNHQISFVRRWLGYP